MAGTLWEAKPLHVFLLDSAAGSGIHNQSGVMSGNGAPVMDVDGNERIRRKRLGIAAQTATHSTGEQS